MDHNTSHPEPVSGFEESPRDSSDTLLTTSENGTRRWVWESDVDFRELSSPHNTINELYRSSSATTEDIGSVAQERLNKLREGRDGLIVVENQNVGQETPVSSSNSPEDVDVEEQQMHQRLMALLDRRSFYTPIQDLESTIERGYNAFYQGAEDDPRSRLFQHAITALDLESEEQHQLFSAATNDTEDPPLQQEDAVSRARSVSPVHPVVSNTTAMPFSTVKALFDFDGADTEELSFRKGDIIKVIESVYKDWSMGVLHEKTGLFPKNYVENLDEIPPDANLGFHDSNPATNFVSTPLPQWPALPQWMQFNTLRAYDQGLMIDEEQNTATINITSTQFEETRTEIQTNFQGLLRSTQSSSSNAPPRWQQPVQWLQSSFDNDTTPYEPALRFQGQYNDGLIIAPPRTNDPSATPQV